MSRLIDQLAGICSQVPRNANVKITIEFAQDSCSDTAGETRECTLTSHAIGDQKRQSRARVIQWLEKALANSAAPDFSFELLDSAQISKRMMREGEAPLRGKALHTMLRSAGFVPLGLIRGVSGPAKFWSVYPENFADVNGRILPAKVRDHLDRL